MNDQELANNWNKQHGLGAHVIVKRAHGQLRTTTRSMAFVNDAGVAVVYLDGMAGTYKLEALTVAEAQPKKRVTA